MMNAEYCPENEPEDGELTTEEIKGIIDRACELGVAHIDFSGGEPLLRKDIFEILEYSSKKVLNLVCYQMERSLLKRWQRN